jgi:hypothetical protein
MPDYAEMLVSACQSVSDLGTRSLGQLTDRAARYDVAHIYGDVS